ncbi:pre-rRNA-processing protein ESF1 [Arthroderma uncinatum]|uniref:pre-rRNA-processing protein ESF1 n=1 Tax=Arthroderma uncinatum TaxID=74035 RepID=UPI00144ACE9F|nr:pre-rRNA-processing protein ESF1 [Arthroderma uncinatum]KAF3483046.1 pre-rRNA-processing protein ESF1 [Arthroderma uncinatum]
MLSDFGSSYNPGKTRRTNAHTLPHLVPPEIFFLDKQNDKYKLSFPSEIWTLGCTIFELIGSGGPFSILGGGILQDQVSVLGKFPDPWWSQWGSRAEFFNEDATIDVMTGAPFQDSLEDRYDWFVKAARRRSDMEEQGEDEKKAFLHMIRMMLQYLPGDRANIEDIVESEWMQKWAIPGRKNSTAPRAFAMGDKMASKKKKTGSSAKDSANVISDPRFANIQSDPRYRLPSKKHTHVKLDKRFSHMLRDSEFSKNAPVDRYGRKLARDDTRKQLEKFYRFEDDDEEKDSEGEKDKDVEEGDLSVDDDEEVQKELRRVERAGYDPARDGGFDSSSSEESSSDEEDEEEEDADNLGVELPGPGQQDADIPTGDYTERIAVVNLDWDNIKAQDLMAVFTSFLPAGGAIRKVSIYPSEFGRERMEMEEMDGPPKEIFSQNPKGEDDDSLSEEEDEEEEEEKIKKSLLVEGNGDDFDAGKLRQYQLERLRYYYAILTCSSKEAAKHIYDAVDGAEYMSSANFFDLRFVPDSTDFTDDVPRDECTKLPDGYQPNDFVTDALQHSKVKLTWDADDRSRKDAQDRAFKGSRKEIDENDLKAYLGSDSSDDEEEEIEVVEMAGTEAKPKVSKKEAERARVRALLGLSDKTPLAGKKEAKPVGEMEVTFSAGLSAAPVRESVFENEPEKEETTREKYVRKERERKQRRKAKLKASRSGEEVPAEDENDNPEQQAEEAEEDLGFDDPFFTAPDLDAANAAKQRKEEKRKLHEQRKAEEEASASKRAELELLMMDDDKAAPITHFDMNEIERAEKRARKAGKHRKGKKDVTENAPADQFEMNVKDPRFQSLFESHEYAIDPTNPRFKQTKAMNTLLEEGRKRRRHAEDSEPSGVNPSHKQKKNKKNKSSSVVADDGEDISKLVEKVKSKTKKK